LKKVIQKWNREMFGHINRRIQCFQEEIIKLDNIARTRELRMQTAQKEGASPVTMAIDYKKGKIMKATISMQVDSRRR